jgi:hypothetical protein
MARSQLARARKGFNCDQDGVDVVVSIDFLLEEAAKAFASRFVTKRAPQGSAPSAGDSSRRSLHTVRTSSPRQLSPLGQSRVDNEGRTEADQRRSAEASNRARVKLTWRSPSKQPRRDCALSGTKDEAVTIRGAPRSGAPPQAGNGWLPARSGSRSVI